MKKEVKLIRVDSVVSINYHEQLRVLLGKNKLPNTPYHFDDDMSTIKIEEKIVKIRRFGKIQEGVSKEWNMAPMDEESIIIFEYLDKVENVLGEYKDQLTKTEQRIDSFKKLKWYKRIYKAIRKDI